MAINPKFNPTAYDLRSTIYYLLSPLDNRDDSSDAGDGH